MTYVFQCFQSHCHILKELHEFLCLISAITIIGKNSFIFSFVDYALVTKSLGPRCTFEEVVEKTKCQDINVNFLQPN
jgi:acyl CoA:acetate/3-ketoacid CoA transferase beta subunit